MTEGTTVTFASFVRPWAAGLVGFLVGEYGAGALLGSLVRSGDREQALALSWLPWVAAPVLGALLATLAVGVVATTRWWHWLVAVLPVPLGAVGVTAAVIVLTGAAATGFALSVVAQLVLAAGVGLALGTLRRRAWRPPTPAEPPVSYVVDRPEDLPA
ncbi:hypothetical protein [Cellulomonas sp. NS3]|uniref:hypothetical protein n=1 Tax=Cellulomonas sp. NS3 TaxID=2973977 RepID=UPI0021632B02|nr:hypothetical protein [Cellulomonas sp. NS3]